MNRSGISPTSPDGKHDTRHEAVAVDRVVADRERLALAAEDDLLVGDQAWEADRVDRLVDVASPLRDQLGGPLRGSRRGVELAVVMELDDLALGHVLGCLLGELHHQDGADREVRGDEALGVAIGPVHRALQLVQVEARRAHHRVDAGLDRLDGVRRTRSRGSRTRPSRRRPRAPRPARPRARGRPWRRPPSRRRPRRPPRPSSPCALRRRRRLRGSRQAASASLTGASALRKRSSSFATATAESLSGA